MLTEQDFACRAELISINGKPCWKYFGNNLEECVQFARQVQAAGEKFYDPLTDDVRSAHRAILDKYMIRLLVAMEHYRLYQEREEFVYPNDFPKVSPEAARDFSTNYNYLVHFGLLAKGNKVGVGGVVYWVTNLGRAFIAGESIRTELFNIGPEVVGYNENSWGTIVSKLGEAEVQQMKKPLWFWTEENRELVLTTDELAIG
jgi:hypothetical protein